MDSIRTNIRNPEKYHWFNAARPGSDFTENVGWLNHAVRTKERIDWLTRNCGPRTASATWVMVDSNTKLIPWSRSYNLQTLLLIGIQDSELAMLFRLKFNL
jgi:hypothetical protein